MAVTDLPEHIIKLLVAYTEGKLTDDEYDALDRWLKKHADSGNTVDEYARLVHDVHTLSVHQQVDINVAWSVVDKHTSNRPGWKKIKRLQLIKYAATLFIPLITLVSLYWYFSDTYRTGNKQICQAEKLTPGRANAILELDGGENIVLGTGKEHTINSHDGEVLTKDSVDVLRYVNNAKTEVQFNKLSVPNGGEYKLILADGTKVWLNSETQLRYPTRFNGEERNIYLLKGEIYLEVAEDKTKPFIVNGDHYTVEVLGTGFNVRDYQDECGCSTTLVHGSVKVKSTHTKKSVVILPNQQVNIGGEGAMFVQQVNAQQRIGWIKGVLYYENATLEQILKDLSRWYSFDYEFEDETIAELRFAGGVSRYDDIEQVIDIISSTNKLKATIHGELITFSYK
ncbi:FecR family protein [Carboxylicivirga taeanensis]|uniref:FecR family protein n=1 Tax=Carboxylicivirga taeanensis TaxID=1416875 RepID=UPI003F6DAA72